MMSFADMSMFENVEAWDPGALPPDPLDDPLPYE